ncbi:hypothetical protein [Nocardiopsis akebiae]|uniref:hypothetical protein n=1 Tax=Nocardiopsis akebiae TaxID=2831968 RepID=UPI0030840009
MREPVARLANGTPVLGVADSVAANDPVTAQGTNMASFAAEVYRRAAVDHGLRPFDGALTRSAFAAYWRLASQVTAWSGGLLTAPPHLEEPYRLAARHQETADRFANCFSDPGDLTGWFPHPERAPAYVDGVRRAEPARSSHLPTS